MAASKIVLIRFACGCAGTPPLTAANNEGFSLIFDACDSDQDYQFCVRAVDLKSAWVPCDAERQAGILDALARQLRDGARLRAFFSAVDDLRLTAREALGL